MYLAIRRLFEIIVSLISLILLLPLFFVIALAIKLTSKGPIIFKQKRIGKNKKYYIIYKFRSMSIEAPKEIGTNKLDDANAYITGFGKFLRKTSLDELPQFFNVLKGDMGFIGPRPCLVTEEDVIDLREVANVYSVKPGITGWAQVHGRDNITNEEKVQYDKYYVEHIGFWIDFKIVFKTIYKVLFFKDVTEGSQEKTIN